MIQWPHGSLAGKPVLAPGEVYFTPEAIYMGQESGEDAVYLKGGGSSLLIFRFEISNYNTGELIHNFSYIQNPTDLPFPVIAASLAPPWVEVTFPGLNLAGKALLPVVPIGTTAGDLKTVSSFTLNGSALRLNLPVAPGEGDYHYYAYAIPL